MYFSSNLSYLRKAKRVTQETISDLIGLTPKSISFYENGEREPTLENLVLLAKFFEVSIDDLLLKDMRPQGSMLPKNLKYLRKKEGYSQAEMAKLLGYQDKSSCSNIENGIREMNMQGLINLSEFFGVSIDDLLKRDLSKGGI